MVDRADPSGGALELARSTTPATARRRTTLAAVPRPAAEVAGLLLVEVLGSPRVRAVALGLARSLAGWLAGRRSPAWAGVEVTTRRITVVQHADTGVLVHRVEMALVVRTLGGPAVGPPTRSNARAARDNRGKRAPSQTALSCRLPHVGDRREAPQGNGSAWSQAATLPRLPSAASTVQGPTRRGTRRDLDGMVGACRRHLRPATDAPPGRSGCA